MGVCRCIQMQARRRQRGSAGDMIMEHLDMQQMKGDVLASLKARIRNMFGDKLPNMLATNMGNARDPSNKRLDAKWDQPRAQRSAKRSTSRPNAITRKLTTGRLARAALCTRRDPG